MFKLFNKNKRERVLIKAKVPYLRNLIGNGIEFTYKPGCVGSGEGWKYWRNFGDWVKSARSYKYVILGENWYNFDVSRYIKRVNPKCKVIVFFWNKIVFDHYFDILKDPNVDEFYTFDKDEAKKYNFKLNSTFYTKGLTLPENKIEKDILFLGRAKDRKKEIKDIEKILKKNHIKTDFRIIEDEKDYIDYYDYLELLSKSKAVLDYNAYDQTGLSLRVMESLFHEKKLITSNKEIKKCDFYNKKNIFIIGIDKWEKLNDFLNSEYEKVPEEILDYYDFENWIKRFQ